MRQRVSLRRCAVAIIATALGTTVLSCRHHKSESPQQHAQADYLAYEKKVREVVKDPARADQVIAMTDQLQREVDQAHVKLAKSQAELSALNANYSATRAQFEALFKRQDADRQALLDKAAAVRVQMGTLLTESEWQALRKSGFETLDADLKVLAG